VASQRKAGTSTKRPARRRPTFVVGLGGSAGGLEAFEQFFASTPADTGMAFVLVTHLDPDHKALLPELIQRTTAMPVAQVEDGMRLAASAVYVIPPNRDLVLEGQVLRLRLPSSRKRPRSPIDTFFRSLAHERGPTAIGVVLSGMGSDGAEGLAAIKAAGGAALVQDPASAAFDAMPRAAMAAVDAVIAAPELLPAQVAIAAGISPAAAATAASVPEALDGAFRRVLDTLRRRTGHDMTLYKRSAIERRLERRLAVHRVATLDAYADYLDGNPEEAELLFRELLIGVTHFFRDEDAFTVLRDRALPLLLDGKREPRTLRAWVAGCSSGEEAYSLAIVIQELLARARVRDVSVQIYATDVDASAIAVARAGAYDEDIAQQVSAERLARYFTREDRGYRIKKEIRETIVFAQHDLIADPPFTRLDVLCCRNVLIYLQPVLQHKLLPQFHYALAPGGLLVLGSSETVSSSAELFAPIDAKAKVFRSLDVARGAGARTELPTSMRAGPISPVPARAAGELTVIEAARRVIVESVAPPTVVINGRGDVLYASRRTGRYLEPAVGKTNINIFAMAREGLGPHLSLAVRQAIAKQRLVRYAGVAVDGDRGRHLIDLTVLPMDEPASLRGLLLVVFEDAAPEPGAKREPGKAKGRSKAGRPGATAVERELTRTKAHLQLVVREMEASQAQVEATNEELQSANEELQSTNEEVTTSKEELQSLNEELLTLNAELEAKNDELATVNDDLRNILNSTKIPTLFLDNALRVKRYTGDASRIANLIPGDVGRAITDITLKLAYADLARDVGQVLDTLVFQEVQVDSHEGATYTMRIHPYRTTSNVIDGVVITFSDVTALRRAEEALAARAQDTVIAGLLDRWPGMVYVHDLALGRDVYLNQRARDRLRAAAAGDARFETLLHPDDNGADAPWQARLGALHAGEVITRRVRLRGPGGAYETFRDRESVLARSAAGVPTRVLAVIEDEEGEPA
jgi:two-component system CheB/CheR fusion protein